MFNWLKDKAFRDLEHQVRQLTAHMELFEGRMEMLNTRMKSLTGLVNRKIEHAVPEREDGELEAYRELERLKAWATGGVGVAPTENYKNNDEHHM